MAFFIALLISLVSMLPVVLLDVRHHLDDFDVKLWWEQNHKRIIAAALFLISVQGIAFFSPEAAAMLANLIGMSGNVATHGGAVALGVATAGLFITVIKKPDTPSINSTQSQ